MNIPSLLLLSLSFLPQESPARNTVETPTDTSALPASPIADHLSWRSETSSSLWENPALIPWRYRFSLSRVSAGAIVGRNIRSGEFDAYTYLHLPYETISGFASYTNGKVCDGQLNASVDPDDTGPYAVYAGETDGSMKMESYSFGGSYASMPGRWTIGVAGAYEAGLHYRTADPRPRDVTGRLSVDAGGSLAFLPGWRAAFGAGYTRYRQSCDVKFESELGVGTIYHLTSLGTVYDRFTGLGSTTYYTSHTWRTEAAVMAESEGPYGTFSFSGSRLGVVLHDLNKLPMARLSTCSLKVSTGWRSSRWNAALLWIQRRRIGRENIFGDASADQYPLLGGLDMYCRIDRYCGGELVWHGDFRQLTVEASGSLAYVARLEQYLSPWIDFRNHSWKAAIRAQGMLKLSRGGLVRFAAGLSRPAFRDAVAVPSWSVNRSWGPDLEAGIWFPLKRRLALGFSFSYSDNPDDPRRAAGNFTLYL